MDEQTTTPRICTEEGEATITFHTLRFGEVTVLEDNIISFPKGLVGLPDARRFAFLHQEDAEGLLSALAAAWFLSLSLWCCLRVGLGSTTGERFTTRLDSATRKWLLEQVRTFEAAKGGNPL